MKFKMPGKWILTGEHAVIRGGEALVFPLQNKYLELNIEDIDSKVELKFNGPYKEEFRMICWGLIDQALEKLNLNRDNLFGKLNFDCHIPLGAGLGASATLCVAISRWFCILKYIQENEIYEFSRSLENIFHGESSGVDIAVSMHGKALKFSRESEPQFLELKWNPVCCLSYTGKKGITSECVNKVKNIWKSHPNKAQSIDDQMKSSVKLCEEGLQMSQEEGIELLKNGIELANHCFQDWGLIDSEMKNHIENLKAQGAIAVKPTGSGGGGYVMSLWKGPKIDSNNDLFFMA